jgi:hypothetical protein
MKTCFTLLLCLCGTALAHANAWTPHDRLLNAVCQIESSGGRFTYGDGGSSLGHYQIQKGAWKDVVAWRKKQNLPTHDYQKNVYDPQISRMYAANYLTLLYGRLKAHYKREPTPGELYAAYNMGMTSFRKCNFDLNQVNPVTSAKCQQLTALVAAGKQ